MNTFVFRYDSNYISILTANIIIFWKYKELENKVVDREIERERER